MYFLNLLQLRCLCFSPFSAQMSILLTFYSPDVYASNLLEPMQMSMLLIRKECSRWPYESVRCKPTEMYSSYYKKDTTDHSHSSRVSWFLRCKSIALWFKKNCAVQWQQSRDTALIPPPSISDFLKNGNICIDLNFFKIAIFWRQSKFLFKIDEIDSDLQ